ncbi:MAG: permease [Chloroflexota bacterium]
MSTAALVVNGLVIVLFGTALLKDKERAGQALALAAKSAFRLLPTILAIIVMISLLLAFVPPEQISRFVGDQAGVGGVLFIAALGAVLHIPAIVSFPLAASLLQSGASVAAVAAFIATLTMVGVVTLPAEIQQLGRKMALLRNGMSFGIALVIALIMGLVL